MVKATRENDTTFPLECVAGHPDDTGMELAGELGERTIKGVDSGSAMSL